MTRSQLVNAIADRADLSKADTEKALSAFMQTVQDALSRGEEVSLVGFGTFTVKERAERTGRNPRTGQEIKIAAAKVPSFRAGKGLKDSIGG